MRIDVMTLFPELCNQYVSESILGRAQSAGCLSVHCRNIRDYTTDRHHRVDDAPYGGGMGMVLSAQPVEACFRSICEETGTRPRLIYMSPKGQVLTQQKARELATLPGFCILCGHYEGVDQRVLDEIVDEEISIGDYVLTGGELPALVLIDAVARMLDGVLSSNECYEEESHFAGLLEYPQYTRPPVWNGREVPSVLLSGHHAKITAWRREQSLRITKERRPDLLERANLTEKDKAFLSANKINE